ncbi:MAG: efflux transporter outer membrane subunit [Burkholderiaceae bacterium]
MPAAAALVVLAGCALPPKGQSAPPVLELPQSTASMPEASVAQDWWLSFGDPALAALVAEALQHNRDLARALARIDEARAALSLAGADRLPSVYADVSARRARSTETGGQPSGGSPTYSTYRAALGLDYDVDLWGRLARADAAARAELLATTTTRDALFGVIAVQVVQAYALLQSIDAQRIVYTQAVQSQRESVRLQRLRFDGGDIAELDLRQIEGELATNEAQLPQLDRARGESERALAVLLGRSPRALIEQSPVRATQTRPAANPALPEALPSDLLQRRPDVRAAEARLAAAGARVDVARAAYFPRIALSASLGQESADLSRLFDGPSLIWSTLASLTQPIWGGGRLRAQSDAALARERIAELDYRDTVANAFKDARDALSARSESAEGLRLAEQRAAALTRAADLTRLRTDAGESSRLQLIDAERLALAAQAQVADARRAALLAQANVFRALGGGWLAPAS